MQFPLNLPQNSNADRRIQVHREKADHDVALYFMVTFNTADLNYQMWDANV